MITSRRTQPLHRRADFNSHSTLPTFLEGIKQRMINHPREQKMNNINTPLPTPWIIPGWSIYPFTDATGHSGVRAEPDFFERNLPQAAIVEAMNAVMVPQ